MFNAINKFEVIRISNITSLFIVIAIVSLSTNFSYSQSTKTSPNLLKWFDNSVGLGSTGLYNGIEYIPKYRTSKGNHLFFETEEFQIGNITYSGETYYNIPLKFDIHDYKVIAKLNTTYGEIILELINNHIASFSLSDTNFIKLTEASNNVLNGFYQVLVENENFTLYKRPRKIKKLKLDKAISYYNFKIGNETFYLKYKGELLPFDKDLKKVLPDYKKEIADISKKHKNIKRLKGYDAFIIVVLTELNFLIDKK